MSRPLKILILDNTREASCFGSKNIVHWTLKMAPQGSEVLVRRPPDEDIPPQDIRVDAIILSGSITSCMEANESWIQPLDQFITRHLTLGTPMLGICYGHQAIARCLFQMAGKAAPLRRADHPELGWQKIQITQSNPLFEGLANNFVTYESHYEEVGETPPGAEVFAKTEFCDTQAFQVHGKSIFGIQFHPEYSIDEAEESLANKLKKGERKDWILNLGKGSKLYDENVGKAIFGNFFRIASQRTD
ncbi:MAG: type 1 glutamine amidotransferase [Bdellovibrionales bacterium]|nr:type 1 glutamine amidotransferase [Bdellovibrionales bacterium]